METNELAHLADVIIVYGTYSLIGALCGISLGYIIYEASSGIARLWRKHHQKKER